MTSYPFNEAEKGLLMEWLLYGDTGRSSRAVIAAALGRPLGDDLPADAGDFARIHALYEAVPGLWKATSVIIINVPKLAALFAHWQTLAQCFRAAPGTPQHDRFADALMAMYLDGMRAGGMVEIEPGVWVHPE